MSDELNWTENWKMHRTGLHRALKFAKIRCKTIFFTWNHFSQKKIWKNWNLMSQYNCLYQRLDINIFYNCSFFQFLDTVIVPMLFFMGGTFYVKCVHYDFVFAKWSDWHQKSIRKFQSTLPWGQKVLKKISSISCSHKIILLIIL